MLGPDIDLLTEIMAELGSKHVRYGVKPEMFPVMGQCLIETLSTTLKADIMTPAVIESWKETYNALAQDMVRSMTKSKK